MSSGPRTLAATSTTKSSNDVATDSKSNNREDPCDRWSFGPAAWLVGLPTVAMIALTTYCRYFWPKPDPATWNVPAYTFVCWAYCSAYDPLWSILAYLVAGIGLVAFGLVVRLASLAVDTEATFGVLALPLGRPALFCAYRRSAAT